MGIQLDWQVESEQARQKATEDPNAKFGRRRRRRRMLLGIILVIFLISAVITIVQWRLGVVEDRIRQDLIDTVNVELTALRIGNYRNFMSVQRSASEEWVSGQISFYDDYQSRKADGQLGTDDEIVDVSIDPDQPRARVLIEQTINGEPYRLVWFYWRYNDLESEQNGWRHVPPDVEYWGDKKTIDGENTRIIYNELDTDLGKTLAPLAEQWWNDGCALLECDSQPILTVQIVPETLNEPMWDLYDPLLLRVPSPLIDGRAYYGQIPDPQLEQALQRMIADKLMEVRIGIDLNPSPYTDTYWIYEEIITELLAVFNPSRSGSAFFNSLESLYGDDFLARVMQSFGPGNDIGILQNVINPAVPVPDLPDEELNQFYWSDFFQWRLRAEQVAQGNDPNAFREFYDTLDGDALAVAQQRFENRDPNSPIPRVISVNVSRDSFGRRIANVEVYPNPEDESVQVTIVFRWTGTTWKRIT